MTNSVGGATIELAVDSSGVDSGMDRVDSAVKRTGRTLESLRTQGGAALDGLGAGAGAAASRIDAATRNIAGAVERANAALISGKKSGAEYFEELGRSRGADMLKLAPLIAQLRETEAAQARVKAQLEATTAAQQAAAEAARVQAAALREVAQAQAGRDSFVAGLREQIALYGKSTEEVLRYRAAQAGAAEAAAPLILQMQNMRAAQDAVTESARREAEAQRQAAQAKANQEAFLAPLREQIALYGKSAEEILRYRAGLAKAGAEAELLIQQLGRLKAADEAVAEAARAAAAAQQQADQKKAGGDAFIASLQQQIALHGKSTEEVLRHRAALADVAGAAEQYIQELARLKTAEEAVAAAARTAAEARRQAAQKQADGDNLIAGLKQEIALYGKSTEEVLRHRAALLDVAGAAEPLLQQLGQLKTAQEAVAAAARAAAAVQQQADQKKATGEALIASLQQQIALYGKSTEEILRHRAAQADVSAQAEQHIQELGRLKTAEEAVAAAARAAAEAQRQAAAVQTNRDSFVAGLQQEAAAIGKTRVELLELKAAEMNVAAQAAPFIQKLREVEQGLNHTGMSARATAAAMRGVPAQFTDIVVSLQGGQAPLTVLLQQGGQLKDMFGGLGNAAKALGGYVLGLINPYTVAAAAAAVLAYAYLQGAHEAIEYSRALIMTGNAAGTSAGQLSDMARRISASIGTQGAAAEALTALASTGRVSVANMERFGEVAVRVERTIGTAVADTAKDFADLAKTPLQASERLNEQYRYLTKSTYDRIKALQDQGRMEEAGAAAQKAYSDAMGSRATELEARLGVIHRGWVGVKDAAKSAWDAMLDIGRKDSASDEVAKISEQIEQRQRKLEELRGRGNGKETLVAVGGLERDLERLRARQDLMQSAVREEMRFGAAKAETARVEAANEVWSKKGEQYLNNKKKMEREIAAAINEGAAAGIARNVVEERLALIRVRYADKGAASALKAEKTAYQSLMSSIGEKIAANKLEISGYDKLTDSQKMSIKLDEEVKVGKNKVSAGHIAVAKAAIAELVAQEAVLKAAKLASDAAETRADLRRSEQSSIDSYFESQTAGYNAAVKGSRDALKSAREEYDQFGMSKSQITEITLLTLRSAQAKLLDGSEGHIALQRQIDDQIELIGILKNGEVREQYKEIFDSIDKTAHDTFVSMFDSGKSVFDRLRDTLKAGLLDLLYQMTIKKWILNVGTSVSNTGVAGIAGAAQAVTGGTATGAIGAAQSAGSLYNAVSGTGMAGMLNTAGSGIAALGTTFGSSAVSAFGAGFAAETGAGIMTAAETFGAAGMAAEASAASLGAAFSAAIPWIGAAVAAVGVWNALFEDGPEKNTRLNFTSNNAAGAISINERGNEGKKDAYIGDTGKSSFGTFGVSSTFWMESAQPVVQSFIKSVSQTDDALAAFLTTAEKASVTSYLTGKTSIAHTGAEGTNPNEKGQLDDVFTDRINNILAGVEPGLESLVKDFDGTSQALATEAAALLQYRAALKDSGEALFGQVATMQQIAALKAPTETSAEALKRVGVEFTATNQVATIFGKTSVEAFGSAGLASETARRQLVLFAGGADALASSTVAYSQNFMSDAERLAPVTKALGAAMDSLGLAGVTTKDQFRAAVQGLVDSGALATEEGAKQYAGLMAIQSTFTQVADAQAAQVAARRAIEIQIMEAQGNAIGATAARRQDELTALAKTSPELVDLQKNLYAVQDAATAAAEASTILGIQASMYEAMGDKAGAAAVLELQHTAALVDMTPAVAAASIALWDAQKAEKARNTELATTNSILGYQQQIAEATGDKIGAAAAAQALFNITLQNMDPVVAQWANAAHNAQIAQKTTNDGIEESNKLLGFQSAMYTAQKDKINLALVAEQQFQNSLTGLSPALVTAATNAHTAELAAKKLADALVEQNNILSAQAGYYEATGDLAGAAAVKLAQQKNALADMTPELAGWTQKMWDAEKAAAITKANRSLEIEILELTGRKIEALTEKRKDEAKGADASTKALLDQRNAAQDVEAAAKVNEAREKIEVQMLELQGKKTEALTVSRRSEFWGLDSTLVPMMRRLHVLQDEATAATEAAAILDLLGQRYEAQGNAAGLAGVKLQQQNAALKEMTPALAAATKATWDAQAAQKLAETRRGIEIEIMNAQGKTAEALAATRADEIKALEMTAPALVGLKKSLYSIQDAAALTEKQHALDIALLEATGKSAAALAVKRFDELAAMNATLRATQLLIYAAEDAASKLDRMKTATDAALAAVQKAVEVEKTRITVIRDAAAESVTSIKSVFDLLKTQVEQLYGTVDSTASMQAAQGQQFIDEALMAAQTGGKLPDQQQLAGAIAAARGGLDATQFATQFEADRAALVMAGKLAQLKDTSGYQLTAAEQALAVANDQLTALDAQLALAQKQVDTLNGINASVLGLKESLAALAAAIAAQKATTAPAPQVYSDVGTALTSMSGQTGGSYATTRMGDADLVKLSGGVSFLANDAWSEAQTASYVSGLMSTYSANAQAVASLTAYGKDEHLPGFDQGINRVPFDMVARIHADEAVVPAAFNPFNPNARALAGGGNTDRLERLVEALTAEVIRLRGDVADGNKNTGQIAEQFDNVTEGGNGIRTVQIEDRVEVTA